MPLLKRARIEVYLPEQRQTKFRRLQRAFEHEFLMTFGGCTVIRNIRGLYLGTDGKPDFDKINLVYTDTPFDFDKNFAALSTYADELRTVAAEASDEESVLVVVHGIYHSV